MSAETPDPADVHPEHDYPTPANRDAWTDEQLAEFNRRQERRLERDLDDDAAATAEAIQAAEALLSNDGPPTETVRINDDVELTVRASMPGWVEQQIATLEQATWGEAFEAILDILCGPTDSDRDGMVLGPEEYTRRAVWREVYELHGRSVLIEHLETVCEPAGENEGLLKNSQRRDADRTS